MIEPLYSNEYTWQGYNESELSLDYIKKNDHPKFDRWLKEEVRKRPYLQDALPQDAFDPGLSHERQWQILELINLADFNAFIRGDIPVFTHIEYYSVDYMPPRIKLGRSFLASDSPYDLQQEIIRTERCECYYDARILKCLFCCRVTQTEISSFEELHNKMYVDAYDYYRSVRYGKESLSFSELKQLWNTDIKNPLTSKRADTLMKDYFCEAPKLLHASVGDLRTALILSDNNQYSLSANTLKERNLRDCIIRLFEELQNSTSDDSELRGLIEPFVNEYFESRFRQLQECVAEIQSEAPNRTAYNRRKKIRTEIMPFASLFSKKQMDDFWALYNCEMPGSLREREIAQILEENNITYTREYTFKELKDQKSLRFDFAFETNGILKIIEYDGELHFYVPESRGGREKLLKTQKHDKQKTDFCHRNNIPLLRLNYKQSLKEQNQLIMEFITVGHKGTHACGDRVRRTKNFSKRVGAGSQKQEV